MAGDRMVLAVPGPAPLTFACPRCHHEVTERFYGPCSPCRTELAATGHEARAVDTAAYEPKANVVPNHVATKD